MHLDESGKAWAMIIGVFAVIFANLAAIVLMNALGR